MTQQPDPADTPPALPALKVPEPKVDPENPWGDDKLDRKEIADRLTSIVRGQDAPFVISLDGRWGTGKTFLLERWAHDLRSQDFEAIYYNAWEDDFADDPLLAIIAQLSEHLSESWGDRVSKLVDVAGPLLYYGASVASLAVSGVPLPPIPTGGDESPSLELDAYQEKRAAKEDLRKSLELLASDVHDETGQPLVFIIDELDRCRPPFAIELLERVKHIFDVPNIVFVFGINRGELVKSLESVYGEIDAGTYLRRFFDMEFVVPEPDPNRFCLHLLNRYRVDRFLSELADQSFGGYDSRLNSIAWGLPALLRYMGLSLRDMDYCVRLLALATRDMEPRRSSYPMLLIPLVAVKIDNPDLYRRFTQGGARGATLIDYFDECHAARDTALSRDGNQDLLVHMEAAVYCADNAENALGQLDGLLNGVRADPPLYVSRQAAGVVGKSAPGANRLEAVRNVLREYKDQDSGYSRSLWSLTRQIDLAYGMTRR
ncbi:MAG: P-loop NTPase fold protein [Chloroflexota bacterium]|nr:P-loop NTPase fold protein [Chloroflexota bacterium]